MGRQKKLPGEERRKRGRPLKEPMKRLHDKWSVLFKTKDDCASTEMMMKVVGVEELDAGLTYEGTRRAAYRWVAKRGLTSRMPTEKKLLADGWEKTVAELKTPRKT